MKKLLFASILLLAALQCLIILYGCNSPAPSPTPSSSMSSKSALSIIVKDAATGNKVPMTSVYVRGSSANTGGASILTDTGSWEKVDTNEMGYAELSDITASSDVQVIVSKEGYEKFTKVINVGRTIGGYTLYITTDEAIIQPTDEAYDPTRITTSPTKGVFGCYDGSTCMDCGCSISKGYTCGAGCGCSDASTSCLGGKCRDSAGGGKGTSSFGKCTDVGCPPGCKNCGACACSSAGPCSGEANCGVKFSPGGGGTSAESGACSDGLCPTGCRGCGSCVCSAAGGCGGKANCTGGSVTPLPSSGKCAGSNCPTGCRGCGSCACDTGTGGCGGSSFCNSGTPGPTPPGPSPTPGPAPSRGCDAGNCSPSCATSPCGSCACSTSGSPCSPKGGSAYCVGVRNKKV